MIVQGRRCLYIENNEKKPINKSYEILDWIGNLIFDSVWIKDLTMLYYLILDDE